MVPKTLAPKASLRIQAVRKIELVIGESRVERGCSDLDDLETARAFEDTMANFGRLQNEVAFRHHEWLALILVDDADPATPHVDHLERYPVVMNPVAHQPTFSNR